MEKQRCTTQENLVGMRLSSDQLGGENGKTSLLKRILCHNHKLYILSLPAWLLNTVLFFPNHSVWSFSSHHTLLFTQPCLIPICWFIFSGTLGCGQGLERNHAAQWLEAQIQDPEWAWNLAKKNQSVLLCKNAVSYRFLLPRTGFGTDLLGPHFSSYQFCDLGSLFTSLVFFILVTGITLLS